jgi:hypothetical protein
VAAGAVLAVVSIAIMPHAFSEVSGLVASATVVGFVGLFAQLTYEPLDTNSSSTKHHDQCSPGSPD